MDLGEMDLNQLEAFPWIVREKMWTYVILSKEPNIFQ